MRKKIEIILSSTIFAVILITLLSINAFPQESIDVNIDKAIEMAFEASEKYKIKENEIHVNESKHREAKAGLYPHLNSTTTWCNNFKYPNNPLLLMNTYEIEGNINMTQLLYSFGRVSNSIKAAQKGVNISRLNKERERIDIIFNTKVRYYAAMFAQKSLLIMQESLNNAVENKTILESGSALGRISKMDNIKILADISSRKPMVNNAKTARGSTMKSLKNILGVDETLEVNLVDQFDSDYIDIEKELYLKSFDEKEPTIEALAERIKLTEDIIKIKKAEFMPLVSMYGAWTNVGTSNKAHIDKNNFNDYGVAGVVVTFPIFNGGEKQEQLNQAKIDNDNAKLIRKQVKEELMLALSTAIDEYYDYINTLRADFESVQYAKDSFLMHQDLLKVGKVTLTEVNDAELLLARMKLNKENTLFMINSTMARIERLSAIEVK